MFPPMEFQFHRPTDFQFRKVAGASVTESMAGDNLPKEDHSSLPRFPPAPPVTSPSDERHNSAHALALGRRSVGEVRGSPRSLDTGMEQQQKEDQGQQLEHVRSLTLDLATTVQELVEMQRKLGNELHEVKLQVTNNSHDLEEFRSSYAQSRSLQRSSVRPPPLASAPPSYPSDYDAQFQAHRAANSMELHHEMPPPTPMSQRSTVSVAKNLGYSDTQDLLHNVHGRAIEGLGSLHDWTARAMNNLITGDNSGNSCCQTLDRQPRGPLTRI